MTTYTVIEGEVVSQNQDGTIHDFLPDPLGHTLGLISTDETIEFVWDYFPFEQVPTAFDGATALRYGGTRGYYSDTYSRPHVGARELRTIQGRWMQVDPIWPPEPAYVYAKCSPVSYSDPDGLSPGIRFTNCPPQVVGWFNKLCKKLKGLSPADQAAVNNCIAFESRGDCPSLSSSQWQCLRNYCDGGDVMCHWGQIPEHPGNAGYCTRRTAATELLGGMPFIDISLTLQPSNIGLSYFNDLIVIVDTHPLNFTWSGTVFLHEMGHACNVWHGPGRPVDWQCNDIMATCLYRQLWR